MKTPLLFLQILLVIDIVRSTCRTENPYGVYNIYCTKITSFNDIPLEFRIPSVFNLVINRSTISLKQTKSFHGIDNLHLVSSNITSIEPDFFNSVTTLRELKIENCTVYKMQPFPKSSLSFLRLYNSNLSSIPNKLLHNLTNLALFTTSGNIWPSLTNFPDNFFKNLPLSVISLEKAGIYNLQGQAFKTLNKLHYLELQNNRLSSLPSNLFQDLGELVNLNLSYNEIRKFENKVFKGLSVLNTLAVAHNKLSTANKEWFAPLKSLVVLDLSYNAIWKCDLSLKNLTILNLSHNSFSRIGNETFAGLPKLSELDLSYNSIQNLSLDAFKGLSELRQLNLAYNKLQVIDSRVFRYFRSLNTVSIESNQIRNLTQIGLDSLKTLWRLYASGNKLSRLGNVLQKLPTLEELYLSNTSLVSLEPTSFQGLKRLQKLDLSQNNLKNISSSVLKDLISLEKLNLAKIGLTKLDAGVFDKLGNLTHLDLEGNILENLPLGIFGNLKLESLSLKGNRIRNISGNVYEKQTKLMEINLENTPIISLNETDILPNLRYLLLYGTKYQGVGVVSTKRRRFNKVNERVWDSSCFLPFCKR
ncbi:hypothetical protein RI129_008956 [Pyrocoelia pectoralis]|uniref:Chaoptin n=1 Tax=Pyrocoelia pectoralis TaxID=417401 RepID=A0AAN7VAT7_9COLE